MAKKHSKFRNTGILFELLVRKITVDTISGDDSDALKIIKEFFNKNSELSKELQLYKTLLEDKFKDKSQGEKFIDLVLEYRKEIDNKKLATEKYELVKAIKEHYDGSDFFKARVRDYKPLAAIFMLFENVSGVRINPSEIINSKYNLLEHISCKQVKSSDEVKHNIMEDYKKMDKDIRLLAYKMLVERFNGRYAEVLNEQQKELLKRYINNISDTTVLRSYINEQIPIIKEEVELYLNKVEDDIIKIKLQEVIEQLPEFLKGTIISENHILTLMRYYSLINNLSKIHGDKE